jgi:hypothetical protein
VLGVAADLRELRRKRLARFRFGGQTRLRDIGKPTELGFRGEPRHVLGVSLGRFLASSLQLGPESGPRFRADARDLLLQVRFYFATHASDFGFELLCGGLFGGDAGLTSRCLAAGFRLRERLLLGSAHLFRISLRANELLLQPRFGFLADA